MAYVTHPASASSSLLASVRTGVTAMLNTVGGSFSKLSEFLMVNSTGYRCLETANRLNALSDADLARRGIKRDDIVRHAFQGFMH